MFFFFFFLTHFPSAILVQGGIDVFTSDLRVFVLLCAGAELGILHKYYSERLAFVAPAYVLADFAFHSDVAIHSAPRTLRKTVVCITAC